MATHDDEHRLHQVSTEMSLNKQQQLKEAATSPGEWNLISRVTML